LTEELKIIHYPSEEDPFIIADKPAGLPSAPLFEGDDSLLTRLLKSFPILLNVGGRKAVEHGLIHRIDTQTTGLVLLATSQVFYDKMLLLQKEGLFKKTYTAHCDFMPDCGEILQAFPPKPELSGPVESYFRPYGPKGSQVRPVTVDCGPAALKKAAPVLYRTEISIDEKNMAQASIRAGYRHQVRCHLAWCGYPVKGDSVYNPNFKEGEKMEFYASSLSFPHPLTGEQLIFQR